MNVVAWSSLRELSKTLSRQAFVEPAGCFLIPCGRLGLRKSARFSHGVFVTRAPTCLIPPPLLGDPLPPRLRLRRRLGLVRRIGRRAGGDNQVDEFVDIEAHRLRKLDEFDEIDPSSARLQVRDDGRIAVDAPREFELGQTRSLPVFH